MCIIREMEIGNMNRRKRFLALLINGVLLSSLCVASAADTTAGSGSGVAYGARSDAPKAENVAIGNMRLLAILMVLVLLQGIS